MKKTLIVIPTLNPNPSFVSYIEELIHFGFSNILIINDGSSSKYNDIFREIERKKECIVYRHAINLGKGRALKNSFNYFLNMDDYDDFTGIITVDSDGQHTVQDVIKLNEAMFLDKGKIYFGSRNFDEQDIPFKSRFGNKLTTFLFWLLYGKKISDTQTGLRGIPTSLISSFIDLKGERFQYEMNMLIESVNKNIEIEEIGIETIYFDNNSETHFHPVRDSIQIMAQLFGSFFKYMISASASFIVDISIFHFIILLSSDVLPAQRILIATVFSRVISSLFNFVLNKKFVFDNKEKMNGVIFKYYALALIQLIISWMSVTALFNYLSWNETLIKILVDTLLFFVSFKIQKRYVFKQ